MPKPKIIYIPPPPNEVERYARQLCRGWAENRSPEYGDMAFVSGFVRFMKQVVRSQAKQMNNGVREPCPNE